MARAIPESWSFLDKMFEETYFPCGWMPRVSATCDVHLSKASDPTSIGNALDCLLLVFGKSHSKASTGTNFNLYSRPSENQPKDLRKIHQNWGNHQPPTPGIHHRWQRNGPLNCRSHRKRWTLAAGIPVPPLATRYIRFGCCSKELSHVLLLRMDGLKEGTGNMGVSIIWIKDVTVSPLETKVSNLQSSK